MIYTLNARDNIKLQLFKQALELSTKEILGLINEDFNVTESVLSEKGILYKDLRNVLTPPHKSNRREIVLCFDSGRTENSWYGNAIMKRILPNINKKRNHAIFQGDFCVAEAMNAYAFSCLYKNIALIRTLSTPYCSQYFLVYINNAIDKEIETLIESMKSFDAFVGYGDMTYANPLKDLIAYYLTQYCLQIGNKILLPHEDDRSNNENINLIGYDYEKFGFTYFSMQSYYYISYLEYKIESRMVDKADLLFSLNAISDRPENYEKYKIIVEPEKFEYIKGKNRALIDAIGIDKMQLQEFVCFLSKKIEYGYIYNLEINEYQVAKFNTMIECITKEKEIVRVLAAFAYNTDEKILRLLNLF